MLNTPTATKTRAEKIQEIKEKLAKGSLDAAIVNITVGSPVGNVTPQLMLQISKKVLDVTKHTTPQDDRDNLRFSHFVGMEDLIHEHITNDVLGLQKKAKMKMEQKKDLSWLHSGFFTPQVRGVVVSNSLSQSVDGHNTLELMDNSNKVTKLGPGGIADTTAIPSESRNVHSSQFGLLDVVHYPESTAIGVCNYFAEGARKGKDGLLYKLVLDKDKKPVWVSHHKLLESKVEVPDF